MEYIPYIPFFGNHIYSGGSRPWTKTIFSLHNLIPRSRCHPHPLGPPESIKLCSRDHFPCVESGKSQVLDFVFYFCIFLVFPWIPDPDPRSRSWIFDAKVASNGLGTHLKRRGSKFCVGWGPGALHSSQMDPIGEKTGPRPYTLP